MMTVSVVVCTYAPERLPLVSKCIESLKKQTLMPLQIILVLDEAPQLIDFYTAVIGTDIQIVVSSGFGLSNARNTGVRYARGDVVAFIDDDAVADEKWLDSHLRNYEDAFVAGVGGPIRPLWEGCLPKWFPEELFWVVGCSYVGLPHKRAAIRNPIGCNMSFRRDVFREIGYFDAAVGRVGTRLSGHEDTEFSIRIRRSNPDAKIVFDPAALVYHSIPESRSKISYVARRSFAEGVSKAFLALREPKSREMLNVEKVYLIRVVARGILKRLFRIKTPGSICQAFTMIMSTCLVLLGYVLGRGRLVHV
jgi:glycosyltransferase involved in cell wall biosynthesis